MGMRDDERDIVRMGRALGDMPMDSGQQEPSRINALVKRSAGRGYRPAAPDEAIRRKFATEIAADQGKLLRMREAIEGTNIIAQEHPVQDAPFFSFPVNFSSRRQAVVPGVDSVVLVLAAIEPRYMVFIRTIDIETFDALADTDLAATVLVGNLPMIGAIALPTSAFADFRRNFKLFALQGQNVVVLIRNTGVVAHDVLVRAHGWRYTAPDIRETSRGVMQQNT